MMLIADDQQIRKTNIDEVYADAHKSIKDNIIKLLNSHTTVEVHESYKTAVIKRGVSFIEGKAMDGQNY